MDGPSGKFEIKMRALNKKIFFNTLKNIFVVFHLVIQISPIWHKNASYTYVLLEEHARNQLC